MGFEGEVLQVGGADNIAQAIMEGGPVETAFTVYADFENYSGGIYEHKSERSWEDMLCALWALALRTV